jgi:hypothetical protein
MKDSALSEKFGFSGQGHGRFVFFAIPAPTITPARTHSTASTATYSIFLFILNTFLSLFL